MTKIDSRINDPDLQAWLNSKKNKSEVTRQALKLLYQRELQEESQKQELKIVVKDG